jgi:plastocyanin
MHRRTLPALGVAVLLLLAACASGSDSATTADSSTITGGSKSAGIASGEPNPASPVVEVNVSVRDGKVAPKPHRVDVTQGATVRLQVTSDVDDVLHVHGFDVEEPLEAGHTTTVELTADQPGVFEVETHETELELLQLEVR